MVLKYWSPDMNVSTMTLRDKFSNHGYQGFIHKNCVEIHGIHPKPDYLLHNTKILYQTQNKLDLPVFEALHIYTTVPNSMKIFTIFPA